MSIHVQPYRKEKLMAPFFTSEPPFQVAPFYSAIAFKVVPFYSAECTRQTRNMASYGANWLKFL